MSPFLADKVKRFSLIFLALAALQTVANGMPVLRCQIDQGGATFTHEVVPGQDPYTVPALSINNRFRFKAVVVGDAQKVDYVKIYAYDNPHRRPVLLHYSNYRQPTPGASSVMDALTGVQTVYSPRLERQMQYQCALLEQQP